MCFSASASFGVSAVLLAGSVVAIKKTEKPQQVPFAAIPLIFSAQQFTEGVLWLSLTNESWQYLQETFTYVFLFFAESLWPIWVPLSVWLLEKIPKRKKIIFSILLLGVGISGLLAYNLFTSKVVATVSDFHISYHHDIQHPILKYISVVYFTATVLPPLLSSVKRMMWVGVLILMSYVITKVFFEEFVISVWCFFAACISIVILYIIMSFQSANNVNNKDSIHPSS